MTAPLRILCVHGIGHQDLTDAWQTRWRDAIEGAISAWSPDRKLETHFLAYDELFAARPLGATETAAALWKLMASGFLHGATDWLRGPRGLLGAPDGVRWTAGMVVQWVEDERLRTAARTRFLEALAAHEPELICAHSLGSLIAYDALVQPSEAPQARSLTFVTFGSQIGNAFVRGAFGGRLVMPSLSRWRHVYNRHDRIFTAPIRLADPRFRQIDAPFDVRGFADHDAIAYLTHPATHNGVWSEVAGGCAAHALTKRTREFERASRKPVRRALLVGINDYPLAEDRLEGCVNDAFLVSSVLQECGFDADDIRVVLDKRATRRGILKRLEWLLDGAGSHDQRVFFYSGHGAQLPGYGARDEVDHVDECLVPWDFDWSPETAITDDLVSDLYSQLPYDTGFLIVLDCCHSGGMTKAAGPRPRGLVPPDDIRHRMLRWESEYQMWVPRDFRRERRVVGYARGRPELTGATGIDRLLGRSVPLRWLERLRYVRVREALGHRGPFLPVILEACRERELSFEYRHGMVSFGAFTYALAEIFRRARAERRPLTFEALCRRTGARLHALDYAQTPVIVGPKRVISSPIPWLRDARGGAESPRPHHRLAGGRRRGRESTWTPRAP